MASRWATDLGTADSAGSFWYVEAVHEIGWDGQLTGVAGASSAVPREESTAFMTQIEGTSR
jgi:hypothetical protein